MITHRSLSLLLFVAFSVTGLIVIIQLRDVRAVHSAPENATAAIVGGSSRACKSDVSRCLRSRSSSSFGNVGRTATSAMTGSASARRGTGTCNRTATDVRGQHATLKSQLTPLFGADWSGTAAAQFAALYEQFNKNAQGLTAALDGIGRLLSQAGASYASVEEQIAASFRS